MTADVVAVVLAAALLHATWNALLKGRTGDVHATSTGLAVCWAVFAWPLVLAMGPLAREAWAPLAGSVAVHVVYFTLLTAAYRTGELSLVYPVARGLPPVLIALGAAAGGEPPSLLGAVGIGLVALGILTLGPPERAGRRAVALATGAALCTAAYTLLDAGGVRASDAARYSVYLFALEGTIFAAGALVLGGRPLAEEVWARRDLALGAGVLSAAGYGAALWAMGVAPVAAVAALRETSVLFAALIGAIWLGEPFGRRRMVAAGLITLGAIAVRGG